MVTRFFLGATEAAISPGFSLITGMWYTRDEQPLRHGLWFAGNSVATAFGGLMAFGVAHIQGSLTAWKVSLSGLKILSTSNMTQWLFIIYGLITVAWAVILLMFLPDTPSSARFLKEYEKQAANERTQNNQTGTKNNIIQWDQVWEALLDYKVWILFFFQVANNVPNGGLTMVSF
jgi:sugar phosphate permease